MAFSLILDASAHVPVNLALVAYACPGLGSTAPERSKFRIVGSVLGVTLPIVPFIDATDDYLAAFGDPEPGTTIWVLCETITKSSGLAGPETLSSTVVT